VDLLDKAGIDRAGHERRRLRKLETKKPK